MSTRATYHFSDSDITMYVHCDGYPEGAARKFFETIKAMNAPSFILPDDDDDGKIGMMTMATNRHAMKSSWAFRFAAGNQSAFQTESHEAHGDTEYRYDISVSDDGVASVKVWKEDGQTVDQVYKERWICIFNGGLCNFINKFLPAVEFHVTWLSDMYDMGRVDVMTCDHWLDRASALLNEAKGWNDDNQNKARHMKYVEKIFGVLHVRPDEVAELKRNSGLAME